jgi:hypothetical protein
MGSALEFSTRATIREPMKWAAREKARRRPDRVPLVDQPVHRPRAVFFFVPAGEVMTLAEREQAIPYDVPGSSWRIRAIIARSMHSSSDTNPTILPCKGWR